MALPSLDKTWRFQVNNFVPSDTGGTTDTDDFNNATRRMLFGIKEALIGNGSWTDSTGGAAAAPTTNWTVPLSSGIVTGAPAGDNWAGITDLRNEDSTANLRSWIVFHNTALAIYLLIDCVGFNGNYGSAMTFYIAQTAFTGGTGTARPTSTDEILVRNGFDSGTANTAGWWGKGNNQNNANNCVWHVMRSTDGECTRVVINQDRANLGFWIFDKPKDPVTGWTNPHVAITYQNSNSDTSESMTSAIWHDTNPLRSNHPAGSAMFLYMCTEGFSTSIVTDSFTAGRNQIDGSYPLSEIGLVSITATVQGRHGRLFDIWYGPITANNKAVPSDNAKTFWQFGEFVFPWNTTTALME